MLQTSASQSCWVCCCSKALLCRILSPSCLQTFAAFSRLQHVKWNWFTFSTLPHVTVAAWSLNFPVMALFPGLQTVFINGSARRQSCLWHRMWMCLLITWLFAVSCLMNAPVQLHLLINAPKSSRTWEVRLCDADANKSKQRRRAKENVGFVLGTKILLQF